MGSTIKQITESHYIVCAANSLIARFTPSAAAFAFDEHGNIAQRTSDSGAVVSIGRLTGLQNDNSEVTTYGYQANGWQPAP